MTAQHRGSTTHSRRAPASANRRSTLLQCRPAALLLALVAGAGAAGLLTTQAVPTASAGETMTVASALSADGGSFVDEGGLGPRSAISEVEAEARLEQVAASRAERAAKAVAEAQAAEAAAEAARPKTVMPVKGARLTSSFAMRWGVMHWGIDLAAPMRTPEYTVADGVVLKAGPASGFGLAVYIKHDNGDVTVYGHMDSILVEAGDYVEAGETIALLGSRGQSTGPHLHFEVIVGGMDGTKIDPVGWLQHHGVGI